MGKGPHGVIPLTRKSAGNSAMSGVLNKTFVNYIRIRRMDYPFQAELYSYSSYHTFFLSILSRSNFDHHLRCGGWLNFEFS